MDCDKCGSEMALIWHGPEGAKYRCQECGSIVKRDNPRGPGVI